jgi:hypothetical protein
MQCANGEERGGRSRPCKGRGGVAGGAVPLIRLTGLVDEELGIVLQGVKVGARGVVRPCQREGGEKNVMRLARDAVLGGEKQKVPSCKYCRTRFQLEGVRTP